MITWTSDDKGCAISIEFDRLDRHDYGRVQYRWTIAADGQTWTAADLRSGSGDDVDEVGMLESLAAFLCAFAEAQGYPDSENRDLFPEAVAPIADAYADEFASAVEGRRTQER